MDRAWAARVCAAAMACLTCIACRPPRSSAQYRAARSLEPATLRGDTLPGRGLEHYRVRVYADAEFRALTPHWRDQFRERLDRVNVVLRGVGVLLVAEEMHAWERSSNPDDLEAVLDEIESKDTGEGVDWVVGLVSPRPAVTSNIHHLGMARLLGKHFVLRSMDSDAEAKALDRAFPGLTARERAALYVHRKLHKETVVFLHEWGHTLGALHVRDETDIMSETYSHEQAAFSDPEAELLRRSLAARAGGEAERLALAKYVDDNPSEEWLEQERRDLVEALRRQGTPAAKRREVLRPILASADDPTFAEAARLTVAGSYAAAWRALAPLVDAYPDQAAVQLLGCQLAAQPEVTASEARAACATVAELRPEDPEPALYAAWAWAHAGDRAQALAAAARASERLDAAGAGAAIRRDLAIVYRRLGAIALAENAATASGDDGTIAETTAWATRARRWCGLPRGALSPELEGEFVELFQLEYDRLDAKTAAAVEKRVAAASTRFSGAPGLLVLRCAAESQGGRHKRARATCATAIAAYDEAVVAHFHLAASSLATKQPRDAERHLLRVLELDPELEAAWRTLDDLYGNAREKQRELRARYRDRFGRDL